MLAKTKAQEEKIIKALLDRGYKEFRPGPFDHGKRAFQKCFADGNGVRRYFLTVYMHEPLIHPTTGENFGTAFEVNVQVYGEENHEPVDMLFHTEWKIDKVEAFMEKLFDTGILDAYDNR